MYCDLDLKRISEEDEMQTPKGHKLESYLPTKVPLPKSMIANQGKTDQGAFTKSWQ
jgi:hypothetical protein